MIYGYARISTKGQCLDRQLDALNEYGVDKIFTEVISGSKKQRPVLNKLFSQIKKGDTLVVKDLSRLVRSVKHLIEYLEFFEKEGINFISIEENIDCSTATGRLLINVLSAVNQFEIEVKSECVKEGLRATKKRGTKLGRKAVERESVLKAQEMVKNGISVSEACRMVGIGRTTYYKYI